MPYATASPVSHAMREPVERRDISPLNGSYRSNTLARMPSPFVSVRNSFL